MSGKRLSTATHKTAKERYQKKLRSQTDESTEKITYVPIEQDLVPGVIFHRLLDNDATTDYVKIES